jgi:NAD(P)H-quinone oxidoreductase subunit 6
MADTSTVSPGPRRGPQRTLAFVFARLAAMGVGVLLAIAVLIRSTHGLGVWSVLGLWAASSLIFWGFAGLALRQLALGKVSTPLFGAATLGIFALLGFLIGKVAAPFLAMVGSTVLPLVKPSDLAFYLFAGMAIVGAVGTAFSRNIIYSAWALLFAFMGVAGLYIFLGADFPAVAQVLIYIGGVLVLILFAIMLTKQIGEDPKLTNVHLALPLGGALGAGAVGVLAYMALMAPWKVVPAPTFEPTSGPLGIAFLTEYLLPFEVASVVLLAALIGSVVIARKEIKESLDPTE